MMQNGRSTDLRVLMVKVLNHAKSAIIKVAVNAFCREQMAREKLQVLMPGEVASRHAHFSSVRAWNARLRFADSKTMKPRSKKMRDIFALCERRPSGFDVYSS